MITKQSTGLIGVLLLSALALGPLACERSQTGSPRVEAFPAQPDRYQDGAELTQRRQRWREIWGDETPTLRSCPTGVTPDDLTLCKRAENALLNLHRAETSDASNDEVLTAAAELAVAGDAAAEMLRGYKIAWLLTPDGGIDEPTVSAARARSLVAQFRPENTPENTPEKEAGGPDGNEAIAPVAGANSATEVHANHSKDESAESEESVNPWEAIVQDYSRASRAGYRRLNGYLRFGPPSVRQLALAQLEIVIGKGAATHRAERVLEEAWLWERETSMKARIADAREKLKARRSERPAAEQPTLALGK